MKFTGASLQAVISSIFGGGRREGTGLVSRSSSLLNN